MSLLCLSHFEGATTRLGRTDAMPRLSFIRLASSKSSFTRILSSIPKKIIKNTEKQLSDELVKSAPIVRFESLREKVYSELENKEQFTGVPWSRFPGLNRLLKGHRRGEFTLVTGQTGSGKTTFLSEYSLDLCLRGVKTLWGSFEIKNFRLCKMMLCQFAGTKFEDGDIERFDDYADKFEEMPMYFMDFHGQQSLQDVIETMSRAVAELDIHHIIIDNVQFMIGNDYNNRNGRMDRFEYQDLVVGSFRKFVTETDCHITLVIHPRKEKDEELTNNSIFGGAKAIQEADNILIVQSKTNGSFKSRKYLQVTKNRYDGELGMIPLVFDKDSLSFGLKPAFKSRRLSEVPYGFPAQREE